ncbi:MAG: type II secretion system protein [Thermodesulfobacteriota bacterium]|nr:type II secretion system protein [Thermodesulfobacteriota bacterium]
MATNRLNIETKNAGFTLLEIMLAMLVLGMVVAMVSLSLSGSIKAIDATSEQGEIYYRAQVAMERISEDLASAVLPENAEFIGSKGESESGRTDELSFASMAHLVFDLENGQPGMGIISYAVRPDRIDEQQLVLLRSDVLYRPMEEQAERENDGEPFLLCDRLRSVRFSFVDYNGEELETWDTRVGEGEEKEKAERRLPAAVSCILEFWVNRNEETSIIFETTVVLPVGLIQAESDQGEQGAT